MEDVPCIPNLASEYVNDLVASFGSVYLPDTGTPFLVVGRVPSITKQGRPLFRSFSSVTTSFSYISLPSTLATRSAPFCMSAIQLSTISYLVNALSYILILYRSVVHSLEPIVMSTGLVCLNKSVEYWKTPLMIPLM